MLGLPSLLVGTGPLPPKALAELPPSASQPTGTQYEVTDYGKNVAIVINGVWRFVAPFRTTWANRPAAALVSAGTELQATDYNNQKWISDGAVWRPAQGRAMLLNKWGTTSAPLAVVTGAVDSQFALTEKAIAAGLLIPGSKLSAQMWVRRAGNAGTAYAYAKIGTTDSYSDVTFSGTAMAATDGLSMRMDVLATPVTSTLFSMSNTAPQGSSTSPSSGAANFNVASDMTFSVHIRAANVADVFSLVGYQLVMEA